MTSIIIIAKVCALLVMPASSTANIRTANLSEANMSTAIGSALELLCVVRMDRSHHKNICKECEVSVRSRGWWDLHTTTTLPLYTQQHQGHQGTLFFWLRPTSALSLRPSATWPHLLLNTLEECLVLPVKLYLGKSISVLMRRLWQKHQRCSKPHPLLLWQPWLSGVGCMPACKQLYWTEQEHLHGAVSCLVHKGGQFSRCRCGVQLCTTGIQHHCCSYTWLVRLLCHTDEGSRLHQETSPLQDSFIS